MSDPAVSGPLRPCDYRCGMCGRIFGKGWSDEEAVAEAAGNGIDLDDAGLVCDDCYKLTPWGADVGSFFSSERDPAPPGTWSNWETSQLTREDFERGIELLLNPPPSYPLGHAENPYLVSPAQYDRLMSYRADPRMQHHHDELLLAYAIAGQRPPLRTASYALGKSERRRARRERRRQRRDRRPPGWTAG